MAQIAVPVEIAVDDVEETVPPLAYGLSQNTPNPFHPNTTIHFSMMETGPVKVTVYDISGKRVRTLVDQTKDAGHHSVVWDGRNDRGETLGSGVYFVRYRAAGHEYWKKAMLSR
jgi:hypothetical protein